MRAHLEQLVKGVFRSSAGAGLWSTVSEVLATNRVRSVPYLLSFFISLLFIFISINLKGKTLNPINDSFSHKY
jgi:hypothetical protein